MNIQNLSARHKPDSVVRYWLRQVKAGVKTDAGLCTSCGCENRSNPEGLEEQAVMGPHSSSVPVSFPLFSMLGNCWVESHVRCPNFLPGPYQCGGQGE